MEVAGLVLGAIPIALYALDNYKRCLQATKDIVKYQATLETFALNIFIQKQLELTLRSIGLYFPEGQLPTKSDLQRRLEQAYPHEQEKFMGIILRMENLLEILLDKLEIDSKGKPRWTNESLQDVLAWEWRRVKRGLSASERRELVQELQHWNDALSKVFEKIEITQDENGVRVQELQSRFNASACNLIRNNASSVHHAFSRLWQCSCAEHRTNLVASWRLDVNRTLEPEPFTLAIQTHDGMWKSLSVAIEKEASQEDSLTLSRTSQVHPTPTMPHIISNSEPKKKRQKFTSLFSRSKDSSSLATTTVTRLAAAGQELVPLQPTSQETPHQIKCLCTFVNARNPTVSSSALIEFDEQDFVGSEPSGHKIVIRCVQAKDATGNFEIFSVADFLASPPIKFRPVTRWQRFSIAAAATLAVLYLCGTPWLKENGQFWSTSDSINLFLPVFKTTSALTLQHPYFGISCAFKSKSRHTSEDRSDVFPTRVRNKILFALGVLLIELCLNRTLASIREQEENGKGKGKATEPAYLDSVILDDFELVERELDRVYSDAGHSYGYAVQRCLRCEFPGRDSTKSFEFAEFRRYFFDSVVAPVYATYLMQVI